MPILRKSEPLPKRPVVILIYGQPGVGKTSLFNTSNNPLLLDFDRGKDRAIFRQDTLVVNSWEDVETEDKAGTFKGYQTIGIDTAKAALDDFLTNHVIKQDYKLKSNKLKMYGAIGDEFKLFLSSRRSEDADIVIIAHSKEEKDGDILKILPDVTGGSYNLLLRIADQVGYVSMVNNRRTLQFEPTDRTVGKNVARLPLIEIPKETDPAFKTFLGGIVEKVKESICAMSDAQKEAIEKFESYSSQIDSVEGVEDLNMILTPVQELPKIQKDALNTRIAAKSKEMGLTYNKTTKVFEAPVKSKQPEAAGELNLQ